MGLLDIFGFGKKNNIPKEEPFIVGALYKTTKDIYLPVDTLDLTPTNRPKVKVPNGSIVMCGTTGYIKDRRHNTNHEYVHETIFFFGERRLVLYYLDHDAAEVRQYFDLFCI